MNLISELSSLCSEDLDHYCGESLVDLIIRSVYGSYVELHLKLLSELLFKIFLCDNRHHISFLLLEIICGRFLKLPQALNNPL